MVALAEIEVPEYLWALAILLHLAWAMRLWRGGMVRRYPALFSYLVFGGTRSAIDLALFQLVAHSSRSTRELYFWWWVITQPIVWTLFFCVVVELYNRILADYKGLQRLGMLVMYAASGLVALLFLVMIYLDASVEFYWQFLTLQERSVYLGLTILCFILVSFAALFRLAVPRNARVTFAVFGLIFAIQAVFLVLRAELGSEIVKIQVNTMPFVAAACMLAGTLLFSKTGEMDPRGALAKRTLDGATEAKLVRGLQSLNDVLVRTLRS